MAYAAEPLDPDAVLIAQTIYAESRGVDGTDHKAAVAWCILNRVDDPRWGDSIREVVTQRHQFAWDADAPVTDELLALAAGRAAAMGTGKAGRWRRWAGCCPASMCTLPGMAGSTAFGRSMRAGSAGTGR